ncbi:MAG TPA: 16S rRNA (cytosine(1402)-N(4))-methyltransferase, partial [Arenibaculum sp.]|nr:16S rRNA (cytosine(1402)-N(4))-methyltransferase [Arenibaculum sp.]
MTGGTPSHVPVMVNEVVAALEPRDGGLYVDGTFGRGGYARAILAAAECRVLGIDRDPAAVAAGEDLARAFPGRLNVVEGVFGDLDGILDARGIDAVDGI